MSDATEWRWKNHLAVVVVICLLSTATIGIGIHSVSGAGAADTATQLGTETETATVESLTFEGDGYNESQYDIIADHPGPPFVWQDRELRLNATIESRNDSGTFYLCGQAYGEESESSVPFECERFTMMEESMQNVVLSIDAWPENATGNHSIVVELYKSELGDNVTLHESVHEVTVIKRDGDLTGDGLKNEEEFEHGTDITQPDTTGNGLTDWEEVKKYGTNPLKTDTTGDGVDDATLVRLGLDPTEPYLLHRYVVGGLIVFAIIIGGTVVLIRRLRGLNTADDEQSTAATERRSDAHHIENGTGSETGEQPPLDESIMTNEEIVCRALQRNDGRMRQSQIVDSTGWSKAKVSRVLSGLEEKYVIQRIRIGRENVVDLNVEETENSEFPDHVN